jgi:hypothetical protein
LIVVCSYVLLFFMWLGFYVIVYKWAESKFPFLSAWD